MSDLHFEAGNIEYEVGEVQVSCMEPEQINELIERFYIRLTQDSYYSTMFAERKVYGRNDGGDRTCTGYHGSIIGEDAVFNQ